MATTSTITGRIVLPDNVAATAAIGSFWSEITEAEYLAVMDAADRAEAIGVFDTRADFAA